LIENVVVVVAAAQQLFFIPIYIKIDSKKIFFADLKKKTTEKDSRIITTNCSIVI